MFMDSDISIEIDNKKYLIIDKFNKENKDFIILKEDGSDEIYASLYEINDDKLKIIPITNDKDYDLVDEYLGEL